MSRTIRQTAILAKLETTAGTDAVPTGAANALLVKEQSITPLESNNVDRALIRPYFGASEQLVGPGLVRVSFTVELQGSGTAGTAPAWWPLVEACAFNDGGSLTSPSRNELLPATDPLKTVTIYYNDSGVLHKLVGAMGTFQIEAMADAIPVLKFTFVGLDGGIAAAALPTVTLTSWRTPFVVGPTTAVDVTLGATYAAGAFTGGTAYTSTGLMLDVGNTTGLTTFVSKQTPDITDRNASGRVELELTAAQEVTLMGVVKANTLQSLAFQVGMVAGRRIMLHAPAVQLINPSKGDRNGVRVIGFDLRVTPVSGNDELRIIAS
jgi:hypothetical protein